MAQFSPSPQSKVRVNVYLFKMEYVGVVVALNANHDFSAFLLPEFLETDSRIFVVVVAFSWGWGRSWPSSDGCFQKYHLDVLHLIYAIKIRISYCILCKKIMIKTFSIFFHLLSQFFFYVILRKNRLNKIYIHFS